MRIIDADILVQDTIQEYARSKQYRDAIIRMVNKAPTIEPKRGEWIARDDMPKLDNTYCIECSQCGQLMFGHYNSDDPNFCPNCGARMKGVDDE